MIRIAAEGAWAPAESSPATKNCSRRSPSPGTPASAACGASSTLPPRFRFSWEYNDQPIEKVNANPDRFSGLAAIAPQSPGAAAKELQRAVKLGLKGAVVNSQRIGNSFAFVARNARGCGVFRVGERCFSPCSILAAAASPAHSGLMANNAAKPPARIEVRIESAVEFLAPAARPA
jgi:Amidohydrolase